MKEAATFFLVTVIAVLVIIFSWFSEGKMIANGSEENFDIFHSQKNAEYASTFWRSVGAGYKISFLMSTYPVFSALGFLEEAGTPPFVRQASLISVLMVIGVFSTYLFIKLGLGLGSIAAITGGAFYMLNIYTLTQIWKRFIYSHMFAWAYLPLFSLLWIKWIDTKKIFWLLLFLISSLFFSFTFNNPVFLLGIWTPAIIFVLLKLWSERNNKRQFIYLIFTSFVGVFLWSAVNIWWLYPSLTLGSNWTSQTGQTWQGDFGSLQAVSKHFPIWEILLLRQSWYLGKDNDWFDFYHNPLVYIISLAVLLIAILGFRKSHGFVYRRYLIVLAVVGLFISKGTNFPFGYTFFEVLFSRFPLTIALRNSYEKYGIVWLFAYTIFFAIGFSKIFYHFKGAKRYILSSLILIFSLGVLVYPMWTGDIFPKEKHRLNIPNYYIEANDYLKQQKPVDNRLFHIPSLIEIERLTYSWGFTGEDPSDNLFDYEVLSKPGTLGFDPVYRLIHKYLLEKNISKLLGFLGVESIILHEDNIYPKIDVNDVKKRIKEWGTIASKKEFGQLTVYTLDKNIVKPRIYAATSMVHVSSLEEGIKGILDGLINTKNTIFVTGNTQTVLNIQSSDKPVIKFTKHSLDRYTANIQNAKGAFILVLNNTFDESWQLTIDKNPVNYHFVANGFANGWVIDKEGDYTAEIKLGIWPWDKK